MTVTVDRAACVSAGICVITADAVFSQDADGLVVLVREDALAGAGRCARDATADHRCDTSIQRY